MKRLYHVSEEFAIALFMPRLPKRKEVHPYVPLVWAIDEDSLPNYLWPRDCPRVCYRADENTSAEDAASFFADCKHRYVIAVEAEWLLRISHTKLCCYEFQPQAFFLQDAIAGYYVSEESQKPSNIRLIESIWEELQNYPVTIKVCPSLWELANEVQKSTLRWSCIRMQNASK